MLNKIRIVATGDSMTDTAGQNMPALSGQLNKAFPGRSFELINQGVGGTRVGYGLWRLTNEYDFNGKKYSPLISLEPDIVLLESFAYNNSSDGSGTDGLAHFRDMHKKMVETIQARTCAKILFVITIAPDMEHFLESVPNFIYTPVSIRKWMAQDRVRYLCEAELIAEELKLPVANAYRASLKANLDGVPLSTFIDQRDCIHPGKAGHELIASVIVDALKKTGWLDK